MVGTTEGASDVGGSVALRRGFAAAASQWLWWVALFAVHAIGPLLDLFAWVFALTWILRKQTGLALIVLVLVASLGLELLRWLVLGGAIHERAREGGIGQGFLPSAGRSLVAFVWTSIVHFGVKVLMGLTVASSAAAYFFAWERPLFRAVPSSAVLAATLTWLVPIALTSRMWTELAFVESVKRDQSYLVSLSLAAQTLVRRIWAVGGIYLLTAVLAWSANAVVAGVANAIAARGRGLVDLAFVGAGQIFAAILVAIVAAFLELARFQAFSAIERFSSGLGGMDLKSELGTDVL